MSNLSRLRKNDWRKISSQSLGAFLNFILPPVCAGCGRVGEIFCGQCHGAVIWAGEDSSDFSSRLLHQIGNSCSSDYQQDPLPLESVRCATYHLDPVRRTLHMMKFKGYFALAQPLGRLMVEAWPLWRDDPDLVIPIPLHPRRQRQRGYNQSKLLVDVLVDEYSLPTSDEALIRKRYTKPQIGLTAEERRANVSDAFLADSRIVRGKRLMLVDDVFTTGSTIASAAKALQMAGARTVAAFCLTTAQKRPEDYN